MSCDIMRATILGLLLTAGSTQLANAADVGQTEFEPVRVPDWVCGVTRMVFVTPGEIALAEKARAEVVHTNLVWPYYPLRRDGGGLSPGEAQRLKTFVQQCHQRGIKVVLGLPPFMPCKLVQAHPEWRVHPDDTGQILKVQPRDDDLGTRSGCNLGPWGDYLVEVLVELVSDYHLDGYSFDGNYHPPLCFCPACKAAYGRQRGGELPKQVNLDDLEYRRYLVWRGERLENHYRAIQRRLEAADPNAALMVWTVNAGRYGHLLTSPRVMSTRMNLLLDLPMQEWWLDETNLGASVAPAFGLAYLRGIVGGRPNASEPYLMSRGNPYSPDSFPRHERMTRALLAITYGSLPPQATWLPDGGESMAAVLAEVGRCGPWLTRTGSIPWAALLVSEQTRQFYAYKNVPEGFLPHVFGVFRTAMEEHLPLDLINDWDLNRRKLGNYRVLVLANAAALSDAQVEAVRRYVQDGGGLVATCETSLCDELGRPRRDFALADVFGVSSLARRTVPTSGDAARAGVVLAGDAGYWKGHVGTGSLSWEKGPVWDDPKLSALVPARTATFKGPLFPVGPPSDAAQVAGRLTLDTQPPDSKPAMIVRCVGKGRVVYFAAGVDAALWSYGYPYQRRLLAQALRYAAGTDPSIRVEAPMCVQATFFRQRDDKGQRTIVHLFNNLNTTGGHGLPEADVPLREETVPIHAIKVHFRDPRPRSVHVEPGGIAPAVWHDAQATIVEMPPLAVHAMLVAEDP